jgi:hypothetical protein
VRAASAAAAVGGSYSGTVLEALDLRTELAALGRTLSDLYS